MGVANAHLFIATVEFKVKMKFTIVTVHHNMFDTSTYLMQYKYFLLTFKLPNTQQSSSIWSYNKSGDMKILIYIYHDR